MYSGLLYSGLFILYYIYDINSLLYYYIDNLCLFNLFLYLICELISVYNKYYIVNFLYHLQLWNFLLFT